MGKVVHDFFLLGHAVGLVLGEGLLRAEAGGRGSEER